MKATATIETIGGDTPKQYTIKHTTLKGIKAVTAKILQQLAGSRATLTMEGETVMIIQAVPFILSRLIAAEPTAAENVAKYAVEVGKEQEHQEGSKATKKATNNALLTPLELAQAAGCTRVTIYRQMKAGKLTPHVRKGPMYLFKASDVEKLKFDGRGKYERKKK